MAAMIPATTPVPIRNAVVMTSMIPRGSEKSLDAGLRATEDQRVDIVRTLVGVHRLQIREHPHHVVFLGNSIAAVHVTGEPRDIKRLATVITFHQGNGGRRRLASLQHAT